MADSGWYPDPGNDGYERYWDGSAWSTSTRPRAVEPTYQPPGPPQPQGGPTGPGPYGQPNQYGQGPYGQPNQYGQPGAGQPATPYQQYQPPGGYVPYGTPTASTMMGAPYGKRVLAYLIDGAITGVPVLLAYIVFIVIAVSASNTDSDASTGIGALGLVVLLVAFAWAVGFSIWNLFIRQGRTGQTIGKQKIGLRLVKEVDGNPVGGGMAFVRYLVPNVISNFTCGIFGLLDLLWPLWDERKQRLVDKWFKFQVIEA